MKHVAKRSRISAPKLDLQRRNLLLGWCHSYVPNSDVYNRTVFSFVPLRCPLSAILRFCRNLIRDRSSLFPSVHCDLIRTIRPNYCRYHKYRRERSVSLETNRAVREISLQIFQSHNDLDIRIEVIMSKIAYLSVIQEGSREPEQYESALRAQLPDYDRWFFPVFFEERLTISLRIGMIPSFYWTINLGRDRKALKVTQNYKGYVIRIIVSSLLVHFFGKTAVSPRKKSSTYCPIKTRHSISLMSSAISWDFLIKWTRRASRLRWCRWWLCGTRPPTKRRAGQPAKTSGSTVTSASSSACSTSQQIIRSTEISFPLCQDGAWATISKRKRSDRTPMPSERFAHSRTCLPLAVVDACIFKFILMKPLAVKESISFVIDGKSPF